MSVLCISREFRSGCEEIASIISERMGYGCVGKKQLLDKVKQQGERWGKVLEEFDEAKPSLWDRYAWEYQGFIALIESYVLSEALKDKVIIIGRAGHILLSDIPFVLGIRLTAPIQDRVARVMKKDRVDMQGAKQLIQEVDSTRAGYIKKNYGKNWYDLKNYDMVFNTGTQSLEQVAISVIRALHERETNSTPQAWALLRGRAVAARIKAAVATDSRFIIPTLDVSYKEEQIILRGIVHNPHERKGVEEIASRYAEGLTVRNELHHR